MLSCTLAEGYSCWSCCTDFHLHPALCLIRTRLATSSPRDSTVPFCEWQPCFTASNPSAYFLKAHFTNYYETYNLMKKYITSSVRKNTVAPPFSIEDTYQHSQWMLKPQVVPNPIYTVFFLCTDIPFYLKKALESFSLAYPNCQHHCFCTLGPCDVK